MFDLLDSMICGKDPWLWMHKISCTDGPRINPRTGSIRAEFVCVGDVEPKTLL
jgi:hypothetical protein